MFPTHTYIMFLGLQNLEKSLNMVKRAAVLMKRPGSNGLEEACRYSASVSNALDALLLRGAQLRQAHVGELTCSSNLARNILQHVSNVEN